MPTKINIRESKRKKKKRRRGKKRRNKKRLEKRKTKKIRGLPNLSQKMKKYF